VKNAPILDLGKYAKLKGAVDDPSVSLSALSGLLLQKSFSLPYHLSYPWLLAPPERNTLLFREIDCTWQIYLALSRLDSLGLPLQPTQSVTHGQRITLIQACKPVAEGTIIGHHPGYLDATMDDHGLTKRINVSASRSLVEISKVGSLNLFVLIILTVFFRFLFQVQSTSCTIKQSSGFLHMVDKRL
jgi:hypothetical protein